MSTTTSKGDDIVSVVWEPSGNYFMARTVFESGIVSDPSPVIEPNLSYCERDKMTRGCGVYQAPGLMFFIAVGKAVVVNYLNSFTKYGVNLPSSKTLRKYVARDPGSRECICVHIDLDDGEVIRDLSIHKPKFYQG